MYLCIYVFMYLCIYVFMYLCIYVFMYLCIYVFMYLCIYVFMYLYVCVYIYIYRKKLECAQILHLWPLPLSPSACKPFTRTVIPICNSCRWQELQESSHFMHRNRVDSFRGRTRSVVCCYMGLSENRVYSQ